MTNLRARTAISLAVLLAGLLIVGCADDAESPHVPETAPPRPGSRNRALQPSPTMRDPLLRQVAIVSGATAPLSSDAPFLWVESLTCDRNAEEATREDRDAERRRERALEGPAVADPVEPRETLPADETRRDAPLADAPFQGPARDEWTAYGWRNPFERGWPRTRQQRRVSHAQRRMEAVEHALCWLAAHQAPDGRWSASSNTRSCDGSSVDNATGGPRRARHDPGVTGLALCAFRAAGYMSRGRHPYAKTVWRGLRYLRSVQDAEGCFGLRSGRSWIYNHAVSTLAMVEAYGATGSPISKASAQKALDFIALARSPNSGWRYGLRPGDSDTSVTGWMVAALNSASSINRVVEQRSRTAPLRIDAGCFVGARAWIRRMTDPDSGRTGYLERGASPARYAELLHGHPAERSESMTACALYARIAMGEDARRSEIIRKGVSLLAQRPPRWDPTTGDIDMSYWYWGSLALLHVGGPAWKRWNTALIPALCENQRLEGTYGDLKGSWDPLGPWGTEGGRVYATAMLALCLETPYRYRSE